jgi:hypothetical protein
MGTQGRWSKEVQESGKSRQTRREDGVGRVGSRAEKIGYASTPRTRLRWRYWAGVTPARRLNSLRKKVGSS